MRLQAAIFATLILTSSCIRTEERVVHTLEDRGYTVLEVVRRGLPTVGAGPCPSGAFAPVTEIFRVEALRFPVPEENPCPLVRADLLVCIYGDRCLVYEMKSECDVAVGR